MPILLRYYSPMIMCRTHLPARINMGGSNAAFAPPLGQFFLRLSDRVAPHFPLHQIQWCACRRISRSLISSCSDPHLAPWVSYVMIPFRDQLPNLDWGRRAHVGKAPHLLTQHCAVDIAAQSPSSNPPARIPSLLEHLCLH